MNLSFFMHTKIQKDCQFLKQEKQNCINAKGMNNNKYEKVSAIKPTNVIKQMKYYM